MGKPANCHQILYGTCLKKWFTKCKVKKDSTFLHCRRVVPPHLIFNYFYLFSDQWSGVLQREDVARMWDEPTSV